MRRITCVVLLIATTNAIYGQGNTIRQHLVWYGLFSTLPLNEKWYLQNEFQERHFVDPVVQHQLLTGSHIHRVLGKSGWETSLGISLSLQSPNEPNVSERLTVPELRPHIEFANKHKWGKVTIDHRYRAEARFFHKTNTTGTALEDGLGFGSFRFRYRLQATIPLYQFRENRYWKFKVSDEIHLNAANRISKNVFEQNRIYGGLGYDIFQNLSVEVGCLNLYQQRPTGDFFNRNILRLTAFHKMSINKKNG
ncbi:MAG TPA: DUF2490 domain-containing protein [Agriterribacter sp.]|nr:DUF2490 domain-containing protein [Agriterribacter sp.]